MKSGPKINREDAKGAKGNAKSFFAFFASSRLAVVSLPFAAMVVVTLACALNDTPTNYGAITPVPGGDSPFSFFQPGPTATLVPDQAVASVAPPTSAAVGAPTRTPRPTQDTSASPTPDAPRQSALDRTATEQYAVQRGDTLNEIGERYGVTASHIAQANGITITDTLFVGQVLLIPLPDKTTFGPSLKLLPDSEFVFGPGTVDFNIDGVIQAQGGYLASYAEDIPAVYLDGAQPRTLSGSEIVRLVATRYSVSPQLLLAVLEHQSGWVTDQSPGSHTLAFPLRRVEVGREGLFRQLTWTANQLNLGYYGWRAGWLVSFVFEANGLRLIDPGLNAGTVGVHSYFAKVNTLSEWTRAVSPEGFVATYARLFGNPFRFAVEPLIPPDVTQPELTLPFEPGKVWAFTGGPHGAWDSGSAWAALDFAPPAEAEGCLPSDEWVVASAPGLVVRSEYGALVVDMDGDGFEGTGWNLFYMHIEMRGRVPVGTVVAAGDRLGHPSCEGGISNGTHVHFARKYNGEWLNAAGRSPFVLDGWVAQELPKEYDGYLVRGDLSLEACDCRAEGNEISRP
jgi:LysM repeat protein